MHYLYLFIAGGLGTLCRYGVAKTSQHFFTSNFPLGTLLSNTISCLILALTVVYFNDKSSLSSLAKLVVITGFCGGFSTFSTFSFETVELIKQGNYFVALANILISLFIGIALVFFIISKHKAG